MEVLPTLLFLVAVIAMFGDAIIHIVFANLVEERIDEICADPKAESYVRGHSRSIRRKEIATLEGGSD